MNETIETVTKKLDELGIQYELEEHEAVESFVILDDWNDMGPVRDHLIWTNPSFGLTEEQVQEAIKILLQNS